MAININGKEISGKSGCECGSKTIVMLVSDTVSNVAKNQNRIVEVFLLLLKRKRYVFIKDYFVSIEPILVGLFKNS